jgi:hypothetical protein
VIGDVFLPQLHAAVVKWLETKRVLADKLDQFTVQYRDPIEAGETLFL